MSSTLTPWLAATFRGLRANNLYNSSAKEILGANIPRMGLVAGPDERREQVIGQFGSSAIHLGLGQATALSLENGARWLLPTLMKQVDHSEPATRVWHLGKSLGIASVVGGALMALPHVRNALSALHTGQTDFTGVVGLNPKPLSPADIQRNITHNWHRAQGWLGGSLATATAIAGMTLAAIGTGKTLPQSGWLATAARHATLPGGRYTQMRDGWAVAAWGLPSYAGQWSAARGPIEKQEVGIGLACWLLSFTVIPRKVEQAILAFTKDKPLTRFGGPENVAWLGQLASSVILYTLLPASTSLLSRSRRLAQKEDQAIRSTTPLQTTTTGSVSALPAAVPLIRQPALVTDNGPLRPDESNPFIVAEPVL